MTNALYDDSVRGPDVGEELPDEYYGDHSPNSPNPIAAYHGREVLEGGDDR